MGEEIGRVTSRTSRIRMDVVSPAFPGSGGLVPEIWFDRTVDLDGERVAVTIFGVAGGHAHPALADAILLDVGFLDSFEANTDIARQQFFVVVGALWIGRQTIG